MQCANCSHDNSPGANFCEACGSPFKRRCCACDGELSAAARFCSNCGTPAAAQAVSAAGAAPRAASDPKVSVPAYTPRHLAEKILSSRAALEGERKHVTVLFADIQGSMAMSETVDPEAWHQIMDRFFAIMAEGIHRFEGTINQYTGDGVMALFGAPLAHEDHAHRACFAALHLQDALRDYANELRLEQGLPIAVRIGLNSGDVVVGRIGDDLRMDYTAQGHTVGLAARMQQIAEPGRTTVTGATEALVHGYFRFENLGASSIKGVSEPVEVFTLAGVGEVRTRLDVSRSRGFSRFVGRAEELETLESALAQVAEGHGQIVGVVAEAGTGKSRLCEEFLMRCRERGITTYSTYCLPHGRALPMFPVMQLYRSVFGLADNDPPQNARDKIAGRMVLLDKSFVDSLPLLFEFLGVPDPAHPVSAADPDLHMRRIIEMLRRFTLTRGEREPIVVLIEDLHWLDPGSSAFLDSLIDVVPSGRVLLVGNFRPEYSSSWTKKSYYRQVPLQPLGEKEISALLEHLLGTDPSLRSLTNRIADQTGGNPFFIEEVVRELAESGHLRGEAGSYVLARTDTAIPVPNSVQAVLAARIDRLDDDSKSVLQAASAIGREFELGLVAELCDGVNAEIEAVVARLVNDEFIYPKALYPEPEYVFKHALTRDVAHASLLGERRRTLHARLARVLVGRSEDDTSPGATGTAALVAHHYELAAEPRQAATWHEVAAQRIGLRHPTEAVEHLRKARKQLAHLGVTAETTAWRIRLICLEVARGLRSGTEFNTAALLGEARAELAQCNDPHAESRVLATEGAVHYLAGDFATALPIVTRAFDAACSTGNRHAVALTLPYLFVIQAFCGPRSLIALYDEVGDFDTVAFFEAAGFAAHGWSRVWRAVAHTFLGQYEATMTTLETALDAARAGNDAIDIPLTLSVAAMCHNMWGAGARALPLYQEARRSAEVVGSRIAIGTSCMVPSMSPEPGGMSLPLDERDLTQQRLAQLGFGFQQANAQLGAAQIEFLRAAPESAAHGFMTCYNTSFEGDARAVLPLSKLGMAECELALHEDRHSAEIEQLMADIEHVIDTVGVELYRPYVHRIRAKLARMAGDGVTADNELARARQLIKRRGGPVPDGFFAAFPDPTSATGGQRGA